jgi:predicted lactoylglutathione lyase
LKSKEDEKMIGYITLGTNDLDAAVKFYDELLNVIGTTRAYEGDTFVAWSSNSESTAIAVTRPFDQQAATVGNGVMVAIAASTPEKVNELHAKAVELGGTDEGAPGPRGENFYAGYFRDLDGNKLSAIYIAGD